MNTYLSSAGNVLIATVAALSLLSGKAVAGGPVAHNVLGQFNALDSQATCLAFWRGSFPQPGPLLAHRTSHWQGIARHPDPKARVMYVSRSSHDTSDLPGHIGAVLIDSADVYPGSARLRSNRLVEDEELATTFPYNSDRVVWTHTLTDYQHPGGMQAAGRYLAVPLNTAVFDPDDDHPDKIIFFDISNPVSPVLVTNKEIVTEGDGKLPLLAPVAGGMLGFLELPDGRYLLYNGQNWYRSTTSDISTLAYLGRSQLPAEWPRELADYCDGAVNGNDCSGSLAVPAGLPALLTSDLSITGIPGVSDKDLITSFQSVALAQDASGIYLFGMMPRHNLSPVLRAEEVVALYRVNITEGGPVAISLTYLGARAVNTHGDWKAGGKDAYSGTFKAGGTVYVSPVGELLVYALEAYDVGLDNQNVVDAPVTNQNYTAFSEFHHPRYNLPGASAVTADTAYVALYENTSFQGFRVELDLPEIQFESWEDFGDLPGPCVGAACDFDNEVSSIAWRLPAGVSVKLFSNADHTGDSMTLTGSGQLGNLHVSHPDLADDAESLQVINGTRLNYYISSVHSRPGGTFPSFLAPAMLYDVIGTNSSNWRFKLDPGDWGFTGTIRKPMTIRSLGGSATIGKN